MLFNVISDKGCSDTEAVITAMVSNNFPVSHQVIKCIEKEDGEELEDSMWFIEIDSLENLLRFMEAMPDYYFSISPRRDDPMDEWDFELKNKADEVYYRLPILWLS